MKKNDAILILVLLLTAAGAWGVIRTVRNNSKEQTLVLTGQEDEGTAGATKAPDDPGSAPTRAADASGTGQDPGEASPSATAPDPEVRTINAVRITVGNEEYGIYSLEEDQEIEIGKTNTLKIEDGKAFMSHADCPDQLCMSMGPVDGPYDLIVCLPNLVVVEGIQGKAQSTDGNRTGDDEGKSPEKTGDEAARIPDQTSAESEPGDITESQDPVKMSEIDGIS